jgi:hypothetical protein
MKIQSWPRALQRAAISALALSLVASPALATWSIVAVNTRTREVCVASATCLAYFNLKKDLPILRIGLGAGAAQSFIDGGAVARKKMWDGFGAGLSPQEIFNQIQSVIAILPQRQYGIVDMDHDPFTFTGSQCGLDATGVTGIVGDLRYAIQGNVIVDDSLVYLAEAALLNTPGDLSQKVMAAMEAARAIGGDGRCSCDPQAPNSCDPLPPPEPFKSAEVGFILLGRVGDTGAAVCNSNGCATGQLYLGINIIAGGTDPDPVIQLQGYYATWRAALLGRPDHILTRVNAGAQSLVADGTTATQVIVELHDVDGNRITHGGHTLTLTNLSGVSAVTTPSAIVDRGDGSYSFDLKAGAVAGQDRWRIVVNDGVGNVTLYPELNMRVDPLQVLHASHDTVSIAQDANVQLVVNMGSTMQKRPYLLLATTTGTQPGVPFAGTNLPLNPSGLLMFTYTHANGRNLPGSFKKLDKSGRGEGHFVADTAFLAPLAGAHVDWAAVFPDPLNASVSLPTGFDLVP